MTFDELITIVREDFLDDVADVEAPTDADYICGEAALLRHLAEAQRQACARRDLLFDETTAEVCEVTLQEGVASYALHPAVMRIDEALLEGVTTPLRHYAAQEVRAELPGYRALTAGQPLGFMVRAHTLVLLRPPSAEWDGKKLTLAVWRYPLTAPALGESPEIPESLHQGLVHWVLFECYSKRDEDLLNPRKAEEHLLRFNALFGLPRRGDVLEHLLENPRDSQIAPAACYGGRRSRRADDED